MRYLSFIFLGLWISLGSITSLAYADHAEESGAIVVIVHKDNKTENLSMKKLARIYQGKQTSWPSGMRITVINRPPSYTIREFFYRIVLKAKPTKKFFKAGDPHPFKTIVQRSSLATKRFVAQIPGAIGYIYAHELDESVKGLAINEVFPTSKNIQSGKYKIQ